MEDFIGGAGTPPTQDPVTRPGQSESTERSLPWEAPGVREDVTKVYNLRLPEPHLLKLKYIAEHTPHSMQQFCLDILLPAIDAKVRELTGRN